MTYSPMDFRLGVVVAHTDANGDGALGHVVGFDRNATGEVILLVQCDDGTRRAIHPANVTPDPAAWPKPWSEARCMERLRDQMKADEKPARRLPSWLRV